ncbi:hypothetical protein PIROE2DRAFT_14789, partial [Piromyces sp. E2]
SPLPSLQRIRRIQNEFELIEGDNISLIQQGQTIDIVNAKLDNKKQATPSVNKNYTYLPSNKSLKSNVKGIDNSIYSVKIPSVHLYIINDTVVQISIAFSR